MSSYYGKYRGKVMNNLDPDKAGRVQVSCPAVLGDGVLQWALPSLPFAGTQMGFLVVPPIGSNVWVEFEGGETRTAIWSGCFWDKNQAPAPSPPFIPGGPGMVIKTALCTLSLHDTPTQGVTIALASGAKITVNETKIEINDGKGGTITMQGPKVSINNGALEVT